MANLDSLDAKKLSLDARSQGIVSKIFVFEFINCTNVPPYSRDATTLLTLAAYESKKYARHILVILCRTVDGRKVGRWIEVV